MLHLKLRPLKALRQGLADGLLNDARPGEADKRTGFGQNNVTQRGKAGGDAAGGGVRENGDVQQSLFREPGQSRAGFRHLHERQNALLHPRAAAGGKKDQGQFVFPGVLDGQRQLFPYGGAHAAHEKAAVQHAHHAAASAHGAGGCDHRLVHAGFPAGTVQLGPVAGEAEGITGRQLFMQLPEGAGVQHAAEPVIGPHGEVVAAQGADGQRRRHVLALALPAAMGAGD